VKPFSRLLATGAIFNLLMILPTWWRDGQSGTTWLIPEVWLIVGLVALVRLPNALQSAWLMVVSLLMTLIIASLLGDALVWQVLSRPLNILLDPLLLAAGYRLLAGSLGNPAAVLIALLTAAIAIGLVMLVFRLLGAMVSTIAPANADANLSTGHRWKPAGLMVAASLIIMASTAGQPPTASIRPVLIQLAVEQTRQVEITLSSRQRLLERAQASDMQARPLPGLAGRDVIIVFIESYGISALDQSRYSKIIRPGLATAERQLAQRGLGMVSGRLTAPIRGGQSWLSHATFLSGQRIDNDYWYRLLLDSGQAMMTDDFRATGHTTLIIAPAIVRPWPEAGKLGFDAVYPAAALAYQGQSTGWVTMPDQYTLFQYSRRLRPRHHEPVFAALTLISSHAPWTPGPPLLDDWSRLDDPTVFDDWTPPERDPLAFWRNTDRLRERYAQSLDYSLKSAFGWARHFLPDDALMIVVGDHQAASLITGRDADAEVPIHIISGSKELLLGFRQRGFENGLLTADRAPVHRMEEVRVWLQSL